MKKYLALLCSLFLCGAALTGCKDTTPDKEKHTVQSSAADEQKNESETEESKDESKVSAEKEEKKSENEIPKIEPIAVPEGGWTEETLSNVIYINGKNVKLPCKFSDFGEEFKLVTDDEKYITVDEKDNHTTIAYKYNGNVVGAFGIECTDSDKLNESPITMITCNTDFEETGSENYVPISVNGIELGADHKDVEKNLNFEKADELTETKYYYYIGRFGEYTVTVKCDNDKVNDIKIIYTEGRK